LRLCKMGTVMLVGSSDSARFRLTMRLQRVQLTSRAALSLEQCSELLSLLDGVKCRAMRRSTQMWTQDDRAMAVELLRRLDGSQMLLSCWLQCLQWLVMLLVIR
jgi:hypothetical protein